MSEVNSPTGLRVDASTHVFFADDQDLRSYLTEPIKSRGWPGVDTTVASPLRPKYAEGTQCANGAHPGSDPELAGRHLFEDRGFDLAVLHPMSTATIIPDWHVGTAMLSATNRMLAERWLDSGTYADRFRGTIRVNPNDIEGAVREIEQWKNHPKMVQIGLPLQTQNPYGRSQYAPLWQAASDAGLPVAVHWEMGLGITHPPTPSGVARTYAHHGAYIPMTFVWHLLNMIPEGVFEKFPDLRMIWADGAADLLTPFIWRMDTFGRPHLEQTPWAPRMPSDYLLNRNYFVHSLMDGPGDADFAAEWLRMTGKEDMVMFGSSYPDWQLVSPEDLPSAWTDEQRAKVLGGNARSVFGLSEFAPA
ncbi:amidohydrolase family protein [Rhodococcus fascians]|nr:amidohydrolase family protein [Rhodococcus fascians]MBY4140956.1 amidohydrolase family protein [Rhodococcus fascians]MBY4219620.1 amidohydrolase family protein [Rhodococcus fascians]MBY4221929.1 amidohydrolase family protein [Rhodococcus fascians]MBY4233930.1 amidohydrolase family protein [Rhodococcus fascians]